CGSESGASAASHWRGVGLDPLELPGGFRLGDLQYALLLLTEGNQEEVNGGDHHDNRDQDIRDRGAIAQVIVDERFLVDIIHQVQRSGAGSAAAHEVNDVEHLGCFGSDQHQVDQDGRLQVRPDDVAETPPDVQSIRLGYLVEIARYDLQRCQHKIHAQRRELPGVRNRDRDKDCLFVKKLHRVVLRYDPQVD